MRPVRKRIRQLNGTTGPYTVKAKVIKKKNVHSVEEGQPLLCQKITFQDEEGTKMKATMYNEELEAFGDVFEDNKEYDISKARVRRELQHSSAMPSYQIDFNINTIIKEAPLEPNYVLIAFIPRTLLTDNHYDVLGVVIYVDQHHQILSRSGRLLDVRDVVILDNSHEQVLTVTLWEELAVEEGEKLHSIAETGSVVGFTALRTSSERGFKLSTTDWTSIIFEPPGEAANALRTWAAEHVELLQAKRQQAHQVRTPEIVRTLTTINQVLAKKPNNTMQEEHHWLQVRLEGFGCENVQLYLACSNCGTGSDIEHVGVPYTCTTCLRFEVISTPRMAVTFDAFDETGCYTFSALTENAEKLLEVKATTLYSMSPQEKEDCLRSIVKKVQATSFYIQVAPAISLSYTQVLRWVLRDISLV